MTRTATAAEILRAGVRIEAEEAVAIAQRLIATLRDGTCAEPVEPPFGPPTSERVVLRDDGSVSCRGCDATPAVSEIARLLEALLPPAPARIPGGLRYTIARALLDVDVAPFDSLDELSETLARYERGPRDQIVIRLLQRFAAATSVVPIAMRERRRSAQATELRRALREAEARLYVHEHAALVMRSEPVFVDALPAIVPRERAIVSLRQARRRSITAGLGGLAAGVLLMATGDYMHQVQSDITPPLVAPPALDRAQPLASATPTNSAASSDAAVKAVNNVQRQSDEQREPVRSTPVRRGSPAPRLSTRSVAVRSSTRAAAAPRSSSPTPRVYPEPSPKRGRRDSSVIDRLRLRWLHDVFTKSL